MSMSLNARTSTLLPSDKLITRAPWAMAQSTAATTLVLSPTPLASSTRRGRMVTFGATCRITPATPVP